MTFVEPVPQQRVADQRSLRIQHRTTREGVMGDSALIDAPGSTALIGTSDGDHALSGDEFETIQHPVQHVTDDDAFTSSIAAYSPIVSGWFSITIVATITLVSA